MRIRRLISVGALAFFAFVSAGSAETYGLESAGLDLNIRPIGDATTLAELQSAFDDLHDPSGTGPFAGPGIDAVAGQSEFGLFEHTATGGSVATFIIELTTIADTSRVGVFDLDDPSNKAEIFDGSDTGGDQALVSFRDTGDIKVNGSFAGGGFGDVFGFYLDVYSAGTGQGGDGDSSTLDYTLYSLDMLNVGEAAQALLYRGDDQTVLQLAGFVPGVFTDKEWIIAFEDMRVGLDVADGDYTDLVFLLESITPVPLPGTAFLATAALGMISWFRRRFRYS